jgi:hypothetical protein
MVYENVHSKPIHGVEACLLIEMAVCVTDGDIDPRRIVDEL